MTSHHEHHGHGEHHERPGHGPTSESDTHMAELLELDAALGAPVIAAALDAAAAALGAPLGAALGAALGAQPRSILDLGAGTGTGTVALATRFTDARVHSLDASPAMLERLQTAATSAGVGERVQPHLVDLDGDWPAAVPAGADLAWAALSLHHVSDPAQVLRQVRGALRPDGVLVVTEMTRDTTYDPADLGTGRGGLSGRVVDALAARGYPVVAE